VFFDYDIKGDLLPPKTLCLTYDDGPGEPADGAEAPDTREPGRFLHEEGIAATFFAVGQHAAGRAELIRQLRGWAHLVANHTWSHPGLVALALSGGDVIGEIERADAALGVGRAKVFVRAPYGDWREKGPAGPDKPTSVVAALPNACSRFPRHVGPVNWDVCAEDWECWRQGLSAEEAARRHLAEIERRGRGIVLMHDSSEDATLRPRNRTVQTTKLLVPVLKRRGYRFVRLDAVPQVRSAARVVALTALATPEGRYLACGRDGGELVEIDTPEGFGVVPVRGGCIALRARNGRYVSSRGGRVAARGVAVGRHEALTVRRLRGGRVAFRAAESRRLAVYAPAAAGFS
jgi:peptidoglycan/xylan/chitin deacetylase (PgdA/CDA1 family)